MKNTAKIKITRHTVSECRPVAPGDVVTLAADEALALVEMNAAEPVQPTDRQGLIAAARAALEQRRQSAPWARW
jgi:hypothetical protein